MIVPSRSRKAAWRAVTSKSRRRRERCLHGAHELIVVGLRHAAQVEHETSVANAPDHGVGPDSKPPLDLIGLPRQRDGEGWDARRRKRASTDAGFRFDDVAR